MEMVWGLLGMLTGAAIVTFLETRLIYNTSTLQRLPARRRAWLTFALALILTVVLWVLIEGFEGLARVAVPYLLALTVWLLRDLRTASRRPCPHCGRRIGATAAVCLFCGKATPPDGEQMSIPSAGQIHEGSTRVGSTTIQTPQGGDSPSLPTTRGHAEKESTMTRGQRVLLWIVAAFGLWQGWTHLTGGAVRTALGVKFYEPAGVALSMALLTGGVVAAYLAMRK